MVSDKSKVPEAKSLTQAGILFCFVSASLAVWLGQATLLSVSERNRGPDRPLGGALASNPR